MRFLLAVWITIFVAKTAPQKPDCATVDVMFVLDASISQRQGDFAKVQEALGKLVLKAPRDAGKVRVAVVRDARKPEVLIDFKAASTVDILTEIGLLKHVKTRSFISRTLRTMRRKLMKKLRKQVRSALILITADTARLKTKFPKARSKEIRDSGTEIYTVGVGTGPDKAFDAIASSPAMKYVIELPGYDDLVTSDRLAKELCWVIDQTTPPQTTTIITTTTKRPTTTTRPTTTPSPTPTTTTTTPEPTTTTTTPEPTTTTTPEPTTTTTTTTPEPTTTTPEPTTTTTPEPTTTTTPEPTTTTTPEPTTTTTPEPTTTTTPEPTTTTTPEPTTTTTPEPTTTTTPEPTTTTTHEPTTTTTPEPTTTTTTEPTTTTTTTTPEPTTTTRRTTTQRKTRAPRTRPPKPRRVGTCTTRADVIFVVDMSGSVGYWNFEKIKRYVSDVVSGIDIHPDSHRVGLVAFSSDARIVFDLKKYKRQRDLLKAIKSASYRYGSANTAEALKRVDYLLNSDGKRPEVPKVVVLVTDGPSNINAAKTIPTGRDLKRKGVTVISVALQYAGSTRELEAITSEPISEKLIRVNSFNRLNDAVDKVTNMLCTDRNDCRRNACENGGRCIDGLKGYVCVCPGQTYGKRCEGVCRVPSDVAFTLDSSAAVGYKSFDKMKEAIKKLIESLSMESCDIRVALVKYNTVARVVFNFSRYKTTDDLLAAIRRVYWSYGESNIADAVKTLRTRVYSSARPNARKIAYLLVDSKANMKLQDIGPEVRLAMNAGIELVPVGFSTQGQSEVDTIAQAQGLQALRYRNASSPSDTVRMMQDAIWQPENRAAADQCSKNPCRNGGTCLPEPTGFSCQCADGFTGDLCTTYRNTSGDIAFVIDTSMYISERQLKAIKGFLRTLVTNMQFGGQRSFRVAIISFAKTASVHLRLAEGKSRKVILSAVTSLKLTRARPYPVSGMRAVLKYVFPEPADSKNNNPPRYVIFIGGPMRNPRQLVRVAGKLKRSDVTILGLELSLLQGIDLSKYYQGYMNELVSYPPQLNNFRINKLEQFDTAADSLRSLLIESKDFCARNPCLNGGKCQSRLHGFSCDCKKGYAGLRCGRNCTGIADMAIVLDTSGSVGRDNFQAMKLFVNSIVNRLPIGSDRFRVALGTFSTYSHLEFYLDSQKSTYQTVGAVSSADYVYGDTNTASGLRLMRRKLLGANRGNRKSVQDVGIFITDGLANIQSELMAREAENLKATGAHVFAIGIGLPNDRELRLIASPPTDNNAYSLSGFEQLNSITDSIVNAVCLNPNPCIRNPCINGGTCTPKVNGYRCDCPPQISGINCERVCLANKDIAFVLDSSGSVGQRNYRLLLEFAAAVAEKLDVGPYAMQFSLVTFGTRSQKEFGFGRYNNYAALRKGIMSTGYRPGFTNIASAMRTTKNVVFAPTYGDRYDAKNIVIFVTDGQSNYETARTIAEAAELRKEADILGFGIGLRDESELKEIVGNGTDIYSVASFAKLHTFVDIVVPILCN